MGTNDAAFIYGLKSERRRIRLKKEDKDKRLIALHKEEIKIRKQLENLGYEPLIPPVQRGWKRTFVVREDVKRSASGDFFQELLRKINTVEHSDRKDFTKKARKKGRKVRIIREQKLRHFYDYELPKVKLTEAQRIFFRETEVVLKSRAVRKIHVFIEPWRYVLKVTPNLITEVKIKDSLLEKRRDEINDYFERNNLYPRLFKLLKGHHKYKWREKEKLKYQYSFKNTPVCFILNDLNN